MAAQETIDWICEQWGGDRFSMPRKLEWVDNESLSTREGLERQAQHLKPGGKLYAMMKDQRKYPNATVMADVGKKAENLVLESFEVK